MTVFVRREPVLNRQKAITASRLIVHAPGAADALAALQAMADIWPAAHDVLIGLAGCAPDDTLLGWQPPANVLLEFPAQRLAVPAGRDLAGRLAAAGWPLCLDGHIPGTDWPAALGVRFVLVDAARHPQPVREAAPALAKGLPDCDAFADAVDNGYAGAAGWFFLRGLPQAAATLNPGHAQIIHILNLVRQNAEIAEVETALKKDIGISFKLLRYINSAGFGLSKQIESFRHAVTLIGYDKLNKWLSLLLVTASRDPAAAALMQTAIARGRFMELAASGAIARGQLDNLFIAGSFSLLDALLGTRLDAVLKEMNLPAAIGEALLNRAGPYAPYLELAQACEGDDVADLARCAAALGLSAERVNRAQVEALAFADSLQFD